VSKNSDTQNKKSGIVLILGRPNVGKSTFLNNIIGQKVSITSPKSQTTRRSIKAIYEDPRGQLLFIDTPGIFKKALDPLSKKINARVLDSMENEFDVVLYMVDHTRARGYEEGRVLGLVRKIKKPIFLLVNKIDVKEPSFLAEYRYLEDETDKVFLVSALKKMHLKPVINEIFNLVNRKYPIIDTKDMPIPVVNVHAKEFLEELIREKIYIFARQEVPYKTRVEVTKIEEKKNGMLHINAIIYTLDKRYKRMLIGRAGRMVEEIGRAARKEIELSANKKVFLDLKVDVDYHLLTNF
jgi:GTPase